MEQTVTDRGVARTGMIETEAVTGGTDETKTGTGANETEDGTGTNEAEAQTGLNENESRTGTNEAEAHTGLNENESRTGTNEAEATTGKNETEARTETNEAEAVHNHTTEQKNGKNSEEVHWSYRSMRRLEMMLAAVGLISIVAADLWAHSVTLVLITAILERAISPDQGSIEALARITVAGCVGTMDLLKQLVGDESKVASSLASSIGGALGRAVRAAYGKINDLLKRFGAESNVACSIGGATGGTVGGAIGGAVRVYLRATDKTFEPVGIALGVVLGRTFAKAFTSKVLNRYEKPGDEGIQGQLGGALGGGTGAYFCIIIGEIIARAEMQYCSMTGGILGGTLGCVIGALRVGWLLEKFVSPLAALFVGIIASLCGVIGLHGSMVLAMLMMRPLLMKLVEQTSTNEDQIKEKDNNQKSSWTEELNKDIPRRAMECCKSMLAAGGFVATMATGNAAPFILGSLIGIAALPELLDCGESNDLLGVASSAKIIWKMVRAEFSKRSGYLEQVKKLSGISLTKADCAENAGIIAGVISGAVSGTVGGATHTLLQIIHPVFGQAVGAALGAIVGWTTGKEITDDILKRPTEKWAAGAIGGALGGNIGAFFGFVTGGVVGGVIGGGMGLVCDKYFHV